MKAAVCQRYGPPDVVKIRQVPQPVPTANEVRVKVHATTVNSGDARIRALRVPRGLGPLMRLRLGLFGPRQPVFGFELAGEVEAVGKEVTRFKPGDRVVGSAGFEFGCHAEYRCLPEDGALAIVPRSLSFADAVALCFGGVTALTFFRCAGLKPGETILVNGASGAVGTMAVQIARHLGAEVTGVASTANLNLVRSLGADHVIDYTQTDFAATGMRYDVIMDNVGNAPLARVKGALEPGGRVLMVIGDLKQMLQAGFNKQVISGEEDKSVKPFSAENFRRLMELAETGAIRPVIDRIYPFERIAEAHARVDSERKTGSVVITLEQSDGP